MTCVIPAWQILEVLEMKEVKAAREAFYASTEHKRTKPKAESFPPASDENPNAREDFTRLQAVAARKQKPGD